MEQRLLVVAALWYSLAAPLPSTQRARGGRRRGGVVVGPGGQRDAGEQHMLLDIWRCDATAMPLGFVDLTGDAFWIGLGRAKKKKFVPQMGRDYSYTTSKLYTYVCKVYTKNKFNSIVHY